ncbi:M23 family metallopeptidase [Heyndrickxia acidicola]|uniref:M23 family metallopeptidase n=1 Tax=Heyndrickxia acidicola TaxID=209389 RepID=A0ABU6MLE5_9BACI|nr:M23 family metallopeptidase [Heyndrickxia acidicola]MED1204786.1 M23 family metallopeptidase [Heyndrickxia acidicola]
MGNRTNDIRREIEKRRKTKAIPGKKQVSSPVSSLEWKEDDETFVYETGPSDHIHPLFKKEVFIFKILASAILVLAVAIMFKTNSPVFNQSRAFVSSTMKSEFQFAAISNWYEKQFGKPLAFLPFKLQQKEPVQQANADKQGYAIPASGKVLTHFSSDGRGIMIQTKNNADVEAVNGGTVIFAGKKADLGNTVIIQHPDSTESWYANLKTINVSEYEQVDKEKKVGTVTNNAKRDKGEFYFAFKKGNKFVDPQQVMHID